MANTFCGEHTHLLRWHAQYVKCTVWSDLLSLLASDLWMSGHNLVIFVWSDQTLIWTLVVLCPICRFVETLWNDKGLRFLRYVANRKILARRFSQSWKYPCDRWAISCPIWHGGKVSITQRNHDKLVKFKLSGFETRREGGQNHMSPGIVYPVGAQVTTSPRSFPGSQHEPDISGSGTSCVMAGEARVYTATKWRESERGVLLLLLGMHLHLWLPCAYSSVLAASCPDLSFLGISSSPSLFFCFSASRQELLACLSVWQFVWFWPFQIFSVLKTALHF